MVPQMNDIWEHMLTSIMPSTSGIHPSKFHMVFDLSDPEKRTRQDITTALNHITSFQRYYHVVLGLNLREAHQIAKVQGITVPETGPPQVLASKIRSRLDIDEVVIHNAQFVVSAQKKSNDAEVWGLKVPTVEHPRILTGAGDHFNAGYCYGILKGLSGLQCLMTGVSTASYYVQTGITPNIERIHDFIGSWTPRIF
jgi:hypothetical protein